MENGYRLRRLPFDSERHIISSATEEPTLHATLRGNPMKRNEFLSRVAGTAFAISTANAMADEGPFAGTEVQIERAQPGRPHAGKVLAAIQPHADDLPIFA